MFVLLLALTLSGKQGLYAPDGEHVVKFSTYEECAAAAKREMARVRYKVSGEFTLACVPAENVHGS
jgi:hypothetical protein